MTDPVDVFGPLAEEYARHRPSYPGALVDALFSRLGPARGPIVDLGSGAGAAVGPLLDRGGRVVSVEPNRAMLAQARGGLTGRRGWLGAVAARAEQLPIATGSAICAVAAQAFHWFEPEPALAEIARALPSGGLLAVVWNVPVPDAFSRAVNELIRRYNPGYGRPVTRAMLATPAFLAAHAAFRVEPPAEFPHDRPMREDAYVGYAFSWSYCGGALEPSQREPFEAQLRATIRRHHPRGEWRERMIAVAHFAHRT